MYFASILFFSFVCLQKLYQHLYANYKEFEDGGLNAMMEDGLVLETDILEAEITKRVTAEVTAQNQLATIRQLYSKLKDERQVADLLDLPFETIQNAITV